MLPPTPSPTQTIIRETKSLLLSSEQFKQRTDVWHARRGRIGRLPGNGEFVNKWCERWDGRGCKNRWWAQRIEDLNRTQISAPWKQLLWRRSHYPEIVKCITYLQTDREATKKLRRGLDFDRQCIHHVHCTEHLSTRLSGKKDTWGAPVCQGGWDAPA